MTRPKVLTIIAWLAIIGGALQILGSLGLVGIGSLGIFIGSTGAIEGIVLLGLGFPVWTGIVLIALGVLGIAFGLGVLAARPWSWTMGIVLYGLNLIAGVVMLFMVGVGVTDAFVTLLSAAVLGYLMTEDVREALGHGPTGISGTPHAA